MNTFRFIPIAEIQESPWNPRKTFRGLDELAEDLKRRGMLQPVLVRPRDGYYELVFGSRRYRAAKLAELKEIPAILRELNDQEVVETQIIENSKREDVHPLEEAEGYRALLESFKWDVETIAARVLKSKSFIYQRLKLAELIPKAKEAFLADELSAGHAILIARLTPKDQAEAMKEIFDIDGYGYMRRARGEGPRTPCSVRELAAWIQQNVHLDLHSAPWRKDDASLVPAAGPCTTCPKRTGYMPELFPDVAKKDTCTDRACFQAKTDAFIARVAAEQEKSGHQVIRISPQYKPYGGAKKPGLLYENQYSEAKPGSCPHARKAIVVEGRDLGQQKTICAESQCKIHRGRSSYTPSRQELARRQEETRKQEKKELVRQKLHAAVREKVKAPLPRAVLELVALRFFDDIWHELRVKLLRVWGWIGAGQGARSEAYGRKITERIRKVSEDELARFLADLAVARDLDVSPNHFSGPDALKILGKHYRVDPGKIERAVTQELAEKRKVQDARARVKKRAKAAAKGNGKAAPEAGAKSRKAGKLR